MTNAAPSVLVVGGDSLVGGAVTRAIKNQGKQVFSTTRKRHTLNSERLFLDFEVPESLVIPEDVGSVLIIAAATNYDRCERDPQARIINVELIPRLARSLMEQGLHVTFVSTNSLFGGDTPWPSEDAPHAPGIPYAQQKSDGERAIREAAAELGTSDRLCVTRLTKILAADTSPIPAWLDSWSRGQPVEPFADLVFAPMSVNFVGQSLATIGELRLSGNLHLSGSENVSYVAFAGAIARKLGVPPSLIEPTTSTEKGVHIAFKPTYSGIGMDRTTTLTGLTPQPLDQVLDDLFSDHPTVHGLHS
jgi:dTDP-4-dehydrorhamnose reductase